MFNETIVRRIIITLIVVAASVFVYIHISVFLPILLALLTAMIFEPAVKLLKKQLKSEKRLLPVTLVFTAFVVISGFILYITLTKVIKSLYEWSLKIPQYAVEIQDYFNEVIIRFNQLIAEIPQGNLIIIELERQTDGLIDTAVRFTSQFVAMLGIWLQSIPNMLIVMLFYLITFFLISLDLPRLSALFLGLFNDETSTKLQFVSHRMGKVFIGYWKAQFILSIGVFIATYISLLFISPDAALIMSLIIWVVDIIPLYVGPSLILVPWGLFAMMLGNVNTGLQLMVLAVVLLVIRRIIEPKVLGDSIGLAALPTVLSMYFGFVFFGVMGLILGPFVYMGIRSAKESGLFDVKLFQRTEKEKG